MTQERKVYIIDGNGYFEEEYSKMRKNYQQVITIKLPASESEFKGLGELLNEIDELLCHLEDFTHGKDGDAITKLRHKISPMQIHFNKLQSSTDNQKKVDPIDESRKAINEELDKMPKEELDKLIATITNKNQPKK